MHNHFGECGMRELSWWELVGQWGRESMAYVVQGGDRSRGLIACEFRPRPGWHDHQTYHAREAAGHPERNVQLRVWDFVLMRNDGSGVRLHPDWSKTEGASNAEEWHVEPAEPHENGLGASEGRGAFNQHKQVPAKGS